MKSRSEDRVIDVRDLRTGGIVRYLVPSLDTLKAYSRFSYDKQYDATEQKVVKGSLPFVLQRLS